VKPEGEEEFVEDVAGEVVDEMIWMDERWTQGRGVFDGLSEYDAVPVIDARGKSEIDNLPEL
jgi:hypothetical protein